MNWATSAWPWKCVRYLNLINVICRNDSLTENKLKFPADNAKTIRLEEEIVKPSGDNHEEKYLDLTFESNFCGSLKNNVSCPLKKNQVVTYTNTFIPKTFDWKFWNIWKKFMGKSGLRLYITLVSGDVQTVLYKFRVNVNLVSYVFNWINCYVFWIKYLLLLS